MCVWGGMRGPVRGGCGMCVWGGNEGSGEGGGGGVDGMCGRGGDDREE